MTTMTMIDWLIYDDDDDDNDVNDEIDDYEINDNEDNDDNWQWQLKITLNVVVYHSCSIYE